MKKVLLFLSMLVSVSTFAQNFPSSVYFKQYIDSIYSVVDVRNRTVKIGGTPLTFKTINGETITGTGNLIVSGSGGAVYPSGSGIPLVVGGTSWGTTITNNSSNWIDPSAHTVAGKHLQYATPVTSITHVSNANDWVLQVPIFHVEVLDNILADTVRISGQYKIVVTDTDPAVVCAVYDPADSLLGSFTVGTDETIGNLKFNAVWNGVNNYLLAQTPDVNDEFGFYIVSNWQDTINTNTGTSVRIQGFNNGSYKVKFVKKDTTQSKFRFVKILKPALV